MLRGCIVAFAVAQVVAGVWVLFKGPMSVGLFLLCLGSLIILGTVFERWRYRKQTSPEARWLPTGERFVDPQTGTNTDVLYDPESGERRYVNSDGESNTSGG
jgi:hypothetical protein